MAHPYKAHGHKNDPKWIGKYADGGSVNSDAARADFSPDASFGKYGTQRYNAGVTVPLTSNVDFRGSGSLSPNMAGPGMHDYGVKGGLRFKFNRGGKVR